MSRRAELVTPGSPVRRYKQRRRGNTSLDQTYLRSTKIFLLFCKAFFFQARQQLRIVYPPLPESREQKIVTQLNSTVTINFTIEAFPRPEPRGLTWVRLREGFDERLDGWEVVEEGVEEDWIELNQDVGPDKVAHRMTTMFVVICSQVEVVVTMMMMTNMFVFFLVSGGGDGDNISDHRAPPQLDVCSKGGQL